MPFNMHMHHSGVHVHIEGRETIPSGAAGSSAISTQIPLYSHPNILSYSHVFPQYKHILPYSELLEYAVFCRFGIIVYLDVF